MNKKVLMFFGCCGLVCGSVWAGNAQVARPNVLIFLVDDLGYGDPGFMGSTLAQTPNLDRFAEQNMVFTSAYAPAPHCSPSRAGILTGQYPARLHITIWIGGEKPAEYKNLRLPEQKRFLSEEAFTMAEYFKGQGYTTAQIGKWHVGGETVPLEKHGFDHVIGYAPGASPGAVKKWYGPYPSIKDLDGPPEEYITDRLTDEAIGFMKSHRDEPFFMMLQHYDVHGPLTAPKEMVKKYTDRGRPLAKGNENATFLAMKESFDQSFGRITATLEELELDDNTIVIFFSDNGGVSSVANNGPLRRGKKWLYEGGIRVPMAIRVPGLTHPGSRCDTAVNGIDFFPTLVELTGGNPKQLESVLDGVSLVPLLKGSETLERDALYWHLPQLGRGDGAIIPPQGMVRMGPWKLIHYYGNTAAPELYNINDDISENNNLAAVYPERIEQMQLMLEKHLNEVDAQRVEVVK